jgi:hypothetical protein
LLKQHQAYSVVWSRHDYRISRISRAEEVPGFAVGVVEAGAAIPAAAEQEAGDSASGVQRNDVPGIFGDDVNGEEMDFAGEIRDGATAGAAMGVDAVEAFERVGWNTSPGRARAAATGRWDRSQVWCRLCEMR